MPAANKYGEKLKPLMEQLFTELSNQKKATDEITAAMIAALEEKGETLGFGDVEVSVANNKVTATLLYNDYVTEETVSIDIA